MKTAVITDEISQNPEQAAKVASDFCLDGIELRSVWDKQPHELSEKEIERIKNICERYGLKVCAISSPFFKCNFNKDEIEAQINLLEKTIQLAKRLDCRIIRGFSFWQEEDFEKMLPLIAEAFKVPAKMLQEADMELALELDPSVYACNGQRLARLVEAIGHPCVKALWDAGNDIYSPVPEQPFPEGYHYVRPYIVHVHLKDAVKKGETAESVKIGTGQVDWTAQLAALKEDGYKGYISLETHYRKGIKISEELLRQPGGADFSECGLEASEECLEALQDILEELN